MIMEIHPLSEICYFKYETIGKVQEVSNAEENRLETFY